MLPFTAQNTTVFSITAKETFFDYCINLQTAEYKNLLQGTPAN